MNEPKLLLSVQQAGQLLGLGRDAAGDLIRSGRLRVVVIGHRKLIPRSELEAWIARELDGHREIL